MEPNGSQSYTHVMVIQGLLYYVFLVDIIVHSFSMSVAKKIFRHKSLPKASMVMNDPCLIRVIIPWSLFILKHSHSSGTPFPTCSGTEINQYKTVLQTYCTGLLVFNYSEHHAKHLTVESAHCPVDMLSKDDVVTVDGLVSTADMVWVGGVEVEHRLELCRDRAECNAIQNACFLGISIICLFQ